MLLEGKSGLICNVANQRSAAWAICKAADQAGARLAVGYLAERELEHLERLLEELTHRPLVVQCDVRDDDSLRRLQETLQRELGQLDFAVHSLAFAKTEDLHKRFVDTSRDGFLLAQEVSAFSLAALAQVVEPLMPTGGSILALSYIGAVRAVPHYNAMGVAKASLEACVRYLASELGPQGIRVNAISAGPMRTLAAAAIGDFRAMYNRHAEIAPLRRNTTQEEVADVAVFLASDMSRGMTGDVVYVDNGYHIIATG